MRIHRPERCGWLAGGGYRLAVLGLLIALWPAAALAQVPGQPPQQATYNPRELAEKAMKGDLQAAGVLGYMYETGQGVRKNLKQAASYFNLAASRGNPEAETNLAVMYANGLGVEQNYPAAIQLFLQAAAQGNANAEYNLGILYIRGNGVKENFVQAAKYLHMAAAQNNADAENSLGELYMEGKGVKQDDEEATRLFKLAVDGGNGAALRHLAEMYKSGRGAKTAAENEAAVLDLYRRAAMKGDPDAEFHYGEMIEKGESGLTANIEDAEKWYWKAANAGQPDAQHALGKAFYTGVGATKDCRQGWFWFALAARFSNKLGYGEDRDRAAACLPEAEIEDDEQAVLKWKKTTP